MARTVIKNGKVISPTGVMDSDVLIDGETIAAVGATGFFADAEQGADKVIDAAGKYVIPGGIDVHTHMELPFGGTFASDTFETGTIAAAWGGVTTIVDMAVQRYGENVAEGLGLAQQICRAHVNRNVHDLIGALGTQALEHPQPVPWELNPSGVTRDQFVEDLTTVEGIICGIPGDGQQQLERLGGVKE